MVDPMQPGNQEVTKTLGAGCLRFPKLAVLGKQWHLHGATGYLLWGFF